MQTLTPLQLADIIFQRPERVTAGILEQRSALQKLRDDLFPAFTSTVPESNWEAVKRKLSLVFNNTNPVSTDKRALKYAMQELKALGWSNRQVDSIYDHISVCMAVWLDRSKLRDMVDSRNLVISDDGFLGHVSESKPEAAGDMIFTPEAEQFVYEMMLRSLSRLEPKQSVSLPLMSEKTSLTM